MSKESADFVDFDNRDETEQFILDTFGIPAEKISYSGDIIYVSTLSAEGECWLFPVAEIPRNLRMDEPLPVLSQGSKSLWTMSSAAIAVMTEGQYTCSYVYDNHLQTCTWNLASLAKGQCITQSRPLESGAFLMIDNDEGLELK